MSNPKDKKPRPVIFGCAGTALSSAERQLFSRADPFGFILFKRNCESPEQIRRLVKDLRQSAERDDLPILIDQEGGRVSRLGPPNWMKHPPARLFGAIYEKDPDWGAEAIQVYARLVADELWQLGITVNCAPVLDLLIEGATAAIGDRAFSRKPTVVAALARSYAETSLAHGVIPVVKHLPGHGRLKVDPHKVLPLIETSRAELESDDFVPFELLKDLPLGMNSHAIFTALDPDQPASLSAIVHNDIIRDQIGFDGLLLSDDLTMKALTGTPSDLARRALSAGADIALHCSGDLAEMEAIAAQLQPMSEESWERWERAKSMAKSPAPGYNSSEDNARLDILLGAIAFQIKTTA